MSTEHGSDVAGAIARLPLIDHHCHGVTETDLGRATFESLISESDWAAPIGATHFDTQLGFAIRRYCAPVLGLDPFASPDAYLERRRSLGARETNERLLRATGIEEYVIETGHRGDEILDPAAMAERAAAHAVEVVRLERLAEELVADGCPATTFRDSFARVLDAHLATAVGVKSIAAYRTGLDLAPDRPTDDEVDAAVAEWTRQLAAGTPIRLDDPVVIRHLLWTAVDRGCAIQLHIGYGDADVDLHRCNPLLLTEFLRRTRESGARVLLLHCYPFHREAGYLAHVFPHVYFDVGLAVNYTGSRSEEIIAETLELAPFHKQLFSSDAFGAAELYHLGALLFRRGLTRALSTMAERDDWPAEEQLRVAEAIGSGNARRVYGLTGTRSSPA